MMSSMRPLAIDLFCGLGGKHDGVKHHASGAACFDSGPASLPSKSSRRKFASAMIAKIPLPLSRHIAATYLPERAILASREVQHG